MQRFVWKRCLLCKCVGILESYPPPTEILPLPGHLARAISGQLVPASRRMKPASSDKGHAFHCADPTCRLPLSAGPPTAPQYNSDKMKDFTRIGDGTISDPNRLRGTRNVRKPARRAGTAGGTFRIGLADALSAVLALSNGPALISTPS